MKITCCLLILFCMVYKPAAQERWRLYDLGIFYGIGNIAKDMHATGFVFLWDAVAQKGKHFAGVEYETATNMKIAGNKYAVDQVNLLYGRSLAGNKHKLALHGFAGAGFYRQSFKKTGSDDKYTSETAVGLKLKLSAQYPVFKQMYLSVNPNITFNFSSTYFSVLGGIRYRF